MGVQSSTPPLAFPQLRAFALIGMSGKDRAPRSCGDVDVELRRLTS